MTLASAAPRLACASLLCCASLLAGCATTRGDGPASTEVSVLDEKGDGLAGEIQLWSRRADEKCTQEAQSCWVDLPAGYYSLTFLKMRAGRLAQFGGSGSSGGERYAGCLRARVQLVPGKKIVCKKDGEFNCSKAAADTLNCGEAEATRYGYKPKRGDDLDDAAPAAAGK